MTELRVGSATDVGLVRAKNEDELLVAAPLFAVADGMGGAAAGEVASATAIRGLYEAFVAAGKPTPDHLVQAAHAANRAVWEQAEANPEMRGMGTTLVALALVNNEQLAAINVGDSRLYLLRAGELRQITSDHNLVAELVAEGRLSKEEAEFHPRRNIMTRALGVDPDVPVDDFLIEGSPGDRFLLCSDGLPRELSDEEIASLLQRVADPDEAAHQLVEEAKRQGGNDNITVVVVDIVADEGKDPTLTTAVPLQRASEEAAQEEEDQAEARSMSRRERRQQKRRTKSRLLTPRVIVFVGLLIALLAAAVGGVAWYARDGYFVGLKGNQIVIYRGRPGGVLWFRPTVAATTSVTTDQVESYHLVALTGGQEEPSLEAARQFVNSMVAERKAAQAATRPNTPKTPPSTRPSQPGPARTTTTATA